jgi:hypothetical protein
MVATKSILLYAQKIKIRRKPAVAIDNVFQNRPIEEWNDAQAGKVFIRSMHICSSKIFEHY